MAASMSVCAPALSQKKRRAILKKERRKRKRQALAQARECGVGDGENHTPEEEDDDENPDEERQQLHNEWLERERLAQEEFQLISEREEAARKRQEEDERRIKEEWEAQQVKEQEAKDQKLQERRNREEAVQKMLDRAESELENGRPWMNPEAPVGENSVNYGTERDIANCPFFLKTGACRFGDRCSRKHVHPASTPTLMIRGMFVTFGMEQSRRDDYDTDSCLEHSEEELHEHFLEFYQDVLPEFQGLGKVVQFKVSCNFEPHLRGNVYIQFDTEEQCRDAFMKFNGRWYAGRQLHCELCPVTRWKNAICGLFDKRKCPKGKHCNFLHVFRNPGNEFWEADRDLHLSPDRVGEGSHRGGWRSERQGERSWRGQRCGSSRSPPRSERSYGRRGSERRRRSRSGERRGGGFQGDDRRMSRRRDGRRSRSRERGRSRSRSRERGRSRSRSRNRERERSSSRDRERDRLRNGSRDKDRERGKSRSRERDRSQGRSGARETGSVVGVKRERSRSVSRDGEEKRRQRDRTGKRSPRGDGGDGDDHTPRHHKHSKKSKKKSKKKHKKKKKSHSLPEAVTSSGESEGDGEEEREDDLSAIGPSNDVKDAQLVQTEGEVFDSYSEAASQNATERDLQGNAQGTPLEMSCKLEGDSLT